MNLFISYFCIPSPDPPSVKKKKKSPARAFRNSPAPRTPPPIKTCSDSPACPIEARLLDLVSATAAVHTIIAAQRIPRAINPIRPRGCQRPLPNGRRHVARTNFLEFSKRRSVSKLLEPPRASYVHVAQVSLRIKQFVSFRSVAICVFLFQNFHYTAPCRAWRRKVLFIS